MNNKEFQPITIKGTFTPTEECKEFMATFRPTHTLSINDQPLGEVTDWDIDGGKVEITWIPNEQGKQFLKRMEEQDVQEQESERV